MNATIIDSSSFSREKRPLHRSGFLSSASDLAAIRDTELVNRFNAGFEDAFVEIMQCYRERMYAVALSHLRNHADAEEITQDVFIRAHRGLARFRGDSSLATWLHRIAFNLSRNRYKYFFCRRRHVTVSLDSSVIEGNSGTLLDLIPSDCPSPANESILTEFSDLVATCMRELSPSQREILVLRTGLNKSYGDISDALGITVGTVKSRIARARESLRCLLVQSYPGTAGDVPEGSWFEAIRSCSASESAIA